MEQVKIAVIGGSGIYKLEGATLLNKIKLTTPFGVPSEEISILKIGGKQVAFLPRHGRGHSLLPTEIPQQANIWALKYLGVRFIIGISAVGSLKEEIAPCDFIIPSQLIDRTRHRPQSFFGDGIAGHVSLAHPFCDYLSAVLYNTIKDEGHRVHKNETYLCMEGPLFSTRAESRLYKSWGAGVIGMTAVPEVMLAREAEISYGLVAMSTDFDSWNEDQKAVTAGMVLENMKQNIANIKEYLPKMIARIEEDRETPAHSAAADAIVTDPDFFPLETRRRLEIFYGKYWSRI